MSATTDMILNLLLNLEQKFEQRIAALEAENEALRAVMPPPAIPPVADVPERVVTGIDTEDEPE